MKHIDLKVKDTKAYSIGDIIASVSGNNFGDQIIEFRKYSQLADYKGHKSQGFLTVYTITNYEGEHWSENDMKLFLNHGLPKK